MQRSQYVCNGQVPDDECVVYPAERVRRPVPEIKAVAKAVEMIRVRHTSIVRYCVHCATLMPCLYRAVIWSSAGR